jgi:hypothetical protein
MVDHTSMKLAMRAYAKTLVVATTGVMSLSATATGYARAAGDFRADGFAVGMEVLPAGFGVNTPRQIVNVTALTLDVDGGNIVQPAAGGRSLIVGLPSIRAFGNVTFKSTPGRTYFEEQYVPGPTQLITVGPGGIIKLTPMYAGLFYVPDDTGDLAQSRYGDAFTKLFAPRTAIAMPNGDILRVREDVGPFPGQLLPAETGFSVMTVTVPFWIQTSNSI